MKLSNLIKFSVFGISTIIFRRKKPILGTIIVTDRCNLHCKHCSVNNITAIIHPYTQVKSEMGVFLDNQIKVKITRDNGTALFEKTFTKKDFAAHLTEKYLKASVLEGLVFDDVRTPKKNEITLAASVSYPMTDLYVPFTLVVTQDGKLSVSKDESMGEMVAPEE